MIEESENTENMYAYWFELIGLMCMLLGFNLRAVLRLLNCKINSI